VKIFYKLNSKLKKKCFYKYPVISVVLSKTKIFECKTPDISENIVGKNEWMKLIFGFIKYAIFIFLLFG